MNITETGSTTECDLLFIRDQLVFFLVNYCKRAHALTSSEHSIFIHIRQNLEDSLLIFY